MENNRLTAQTAPLCGRSATPLATGRRGPVAKRRYQEGLFKQENRQRPTRNGSQAKELLDALASMSAGEKTRSEIRKIGSSG